MGILLTLVRGRDRIFHHCLLVEGGVTCWRYLSALSISVNSLYSTLWWNGTLTTPLVEAAADAAAGGGVAS